MRIFASAHMPIWLYGDMKSLSHEHVSLIVGRARALGDPTRLRILEVLARGEQPVGQVAEAVDSQPSTVSKHLQVLFQAGLVERRRQASTVIYSIADEGLVEWLQYLAAKHLSQPRRRQRV